MSASPAAAAPGGWVRVWDPFVRLFHWSLAASFVFAWFSAQRAEALHDCAGYAAGALVALRVLWGFLGAGYARFAQFVRSPATVLGYLRAIARGGEARYLGHNPAGGAMILALLAAMAVVVFTGHLLTTDPFWGSSEAQVWHSFAADALLVLVLTHLAGVALASIRHRESLVGAMVTGFKRPPAPGDVA